MRRTFPRLLTAVGGITAADLLKMLNKTHVLSAPLVGPLPPQPGGEPSGSNRHNLWRLGAAAAIITPLVFLGHKKLSKQKVPTPIYPGVSILPNLFIGPRLSSSQDESSKNIDNLVDIVLDPAQMTELEKYSPPVLSDFWAKPNRLLRASHTLKFYPDDIRLMNIIEATSAFMREALARNETVYVQGYVESPSQPIIVMAFLVEDGLIDHSDDGKLRGIHVSNLNPAQLKARINDVIDHLKPLVPGVNFDSNSGRALLAEYAKHLKLVKQGAYSSKRALSPKESRLFMKMLWGCTSKIGLDIGLNDHCWPESYRYVLLDERQQANRGERLSLK